MVPEYELSMRSEEINFISDISKEKISEIWLIRSRIHGKSRFNRHGFVRADAILLRGNSDIYILPDPRTMPSGYDEILVGVAHEDPNGGMPRTLFARFSNNKEPVSRVKREQENHFSAMIGFLSTISHQTLARCYQYLAAAFPNLAENHPLSRLKSFFPHPVKTLRSERYVPSIVRERGPVIRGNDPKASPVYFHIYDAGVVFRGNDENAILVMAHMSETWTVEISLDNEAIDRELANYALVPLR